MIDIKVIVTEDNGTTTNFINSNVTYISFNEDIYCTTIRISEEIISNISLRQFISKDIKECKILTNNKLLLSIINPKLSYSLDSKTNREILEFIQEKGGNNA